MKNKKSKKIIVASVFAMLYQAITPNTDQAIISKQLVKTKTCTSKFTEKDVDNFTQCQRALAQNPHNFESLVNLAHQFLSKEEYNEAYLLYKKALRLVPESIVCIMGLAHIYEIKNKIKKALYYYKKATQLCPTLTYAFLKLASINYKSGQLEEALRYYKKAASLKPNDTALLFRIASISNNLGQTKEAAKIFLKIAELEPENCVSSLYNAGYALKVCGEIDDAINLYNSALKISPDYENAIYAKALAYLYKGDFERGWKEYEWRLIQEKRNAPHLRTFLANKTISGKRLFFIPEGGVGDTLQFIRYVKLFHDMGAHITVAERPVLQKLLANCPYIDKLINTNEKPDYYDDYASIMSLPAICVSKEEDIPLSIPYIFPDKTLEEKWRNYFEQASTNAHNQNNQTKTLKIGLCWEADLKNDESRPRCAHRSIPLIKLEKLSQIPNVEFYSLQKKSNLSHSKDMPEHFVIHNFGPDFDKKSGPFMDTVAIIKQLDLVITVDTAIAHLAGALGAQVWLMLPYNTDWRWIAGRNSSPWYPTMRIFKQPQAFDWDTVVQQIYNLLQEMSHQLTNEQTQKDSCQINADTIPPKQNLEAIRCLVQQNNAESLSLAEKKIKKLVAQFPEHANTQHNTAHILKLQGKFSEAIGYYKKAIALDPELEVSYLGLAKCLLATGQMNQTAWRLLEYRFANYKKDSQNFNHYHIQPHDLANKTVYLVQEWGLGDMMQFIRYAKCLKDCGATVIISIHKPLRKLLSLCPYIDTILCENMIMPHYDYKIPVMSLPIIFDTTLDTIPANIPYLYADPTLVQYWQEKLTQTSNSTNNKTPFRIGLCWHAKPICLEENFLTRRSVPLKEFASLADIENTHFYNLQKIFGLEELQDLPDGFAITDFGSDFDTTHGRFMDTAALMQNLDLIITADTSIAHLAGALGKPVWILIPYVAEWRWLQYGNSTPWYPNMRLFRQKKPSDWTHVIQEIKKELQTLTLQKNKGNK